MTTIGSAHRFNDLPSFRVDYDVDAANWVVRKQNGTVLNHIMCFRCFCYIENFDDVLAPVTTRYGRASTRRTNQPVIVYQNGFYVMQHINCTPASYFIEFEDNDSDAGEQRQRAVAQIVRAAEAETAMAVAASAAASSWPLSCGPGGS